MIFFFLSTHRATQLCLRIKIKKPRRDLEGSTQCGKFLTAGPTCLLASIHQHTPDGTELTPPDAAVEQPESQGNY